MSEGITSSEDLHTSETLRHLEDVLRYDARRALASARELLDSHEHDTGSVTYQRLLLAKGTAQTRLGETEQGARIMREVRLWAEAHGSPALLALCHRRLSALFRRLGDPALMLEHAVTAVDLLGDDTDDATRADHLLGLADALGASGSYVESIARYREAAVLAEGSGDRFVALAVLNNLAFTQYEAGLGDEAVATAERLRSETERDGGSMLTHDGDTVARAFMSVGRYDDAAAVLEPLCAAPDSGEDSDGLVLALLALAEVRRRAGSFVSAQAHLDRANRLAEEYSLHGASIELLREQAELHAASGMFREAFETYRDFHDADVELRAADRDSRARTLNAIFEATEARRSSDYFRELSHHDPLTGLHNRRHLDDRLGELLQRVATGTTHLTVGLVDLDHFKRVNDARSHGVGDEVLRRIATLLQAAADRVEDGLAVRMGGEEFLVLLPGVDHPEGVASLEVLRREIAGYPWQAVTDGIPVTASVGVATAPQDADDQSSLLSVADRNLYRAKRAGRDRVMSSR